MTEACAHPSRGAPGESRHSLRPLSVAFAITASYFVVELAGGLWTRSLALVSDAMHMAVDTIALGMSLFAARASTLPPDRKRTFGYQRLEVLAALGNGIWLWVATGIILREAYSRFFNPTLVKAPQMFAVAAAGLLCNLASGWILFRASRENINARGAFMHIVVDSLGSLGALAAGLVILKTGWSQADPLASVLICVGTIVTSFWLVRDSVHILLEGAPPHLDIEEIRSSLGRLAGVKEVHDLHIWSLTKGSESLSGHLVVQAGCDAAEVLKAGTELLRRDFGLSHVTLQIET